MIEDITATPAVGDVHRHAHMPSQFIESRHVDVWVPPGFDADAKTRYPVIYMQDGQNLFDPASAYTGVDWGVAEAITRLHAEERIPAAIVVGVWCTPERRREYMPQKPLETPEAGALRARFVREWEGAPISDAYLRFLVEELKPFIDASYPTLPDQPSTFIMGSSMGGLLSLYALIEYPHIFGGAGCLSTHWPIGGSLLVDALGAALPSPATHKIYFDFGTATLDADYEPYQRRMDSWMAAAGYTLGQNWLTEKFAGAEHTESAWRARVHIPLQFLLA